MVDKQFIQSGNWTIDQRNVLAEFINHICVNEVEIIDNKSILESAIECPLVHKNLGLGPLAPTAV